MWSCINCSLWMHQTFHISIYLLENSILDFYYFSFYKSCGFGPFSISRSRFIMYNKKVIKQHHPLFLDVKLSTAHIKNIFLSPDQLWFKVCHTCTKVLLTAWFSKGSQSISIPKILPWSLTHGDWQNCWAGVNESLCSSALSSLTAGRSCKSTSSAIQDTHKIRQREQVILGLLLLLLIIIIR